MRFCNILIVVLGLFCEFALGVLHAQSNSVSYNYRYITMRGGLCDNTIRAIHKDRNGFMWIGTSNGLDRYDGYDFKHYSVSLKFPDRFIESNYINDIDEDSSGHLWVATESGVMFIDLGDERIESFKGYAGKYKEVLQTPVQTILIDGFDNLWIGKNDCVAYVRLNEERSIEDIQILKSDVDIRMFVCHGSDVWAGGYGCLFRFVHSGRQHYSLMPLPAGFNMSDLIFTSAHSWGDYLWLGTQSGLYCCDTRSVSFTCYRHIPGDAESLSSDFVTDITRNASGDLVIGTRNGVNVFRQGRHFMAYTQGNTSQSLNDNLITRLFVDDSNNIWAGSEFGGINIMSPVRISFSYFLRGYDKGTLNIISTVIEDDEGNILAGMVDGGLAIRRKGSGEFRFYRHNPGDSRSLAHDNISRIVQDFDGDYWIATIGGGLDKLSKKHLDAPVFEHHNTSNSPLPSNDIYDIALDSLRNSLWICGNNYIHTLAFSSGAINQLRYYTHTGEEMHNMNTIFVDSRSRLWIGGNGVGVIDLENSKGGYECFYYRYKLDSPASKIGEKITCIVETKDGSVYLGSLGNGMYLLENGDRLDKCVFKNYDVRCGLSDASVSNILDDDSGNLWISTLKGVYFFDITTQRAFKFDQEDGLLVPQFYRRAGWKSSGHTLLLGTTDGLVAFKPLMNFSKPKQREVTLTEASFGGQPLIACRHPENLAASIVTADELHLYPPQNSFEVTYSCLEFLEPEKVFYFYRMLGMDETGNVGLMNRNAKYTNLSPGTYTLEIRCTNHDNTWSSERKRLKIVVHPPFYRTGWFYALMASAGILILAGLLYWYNARQRYIQRLLKRKIDERTKELHETITELTTSRETIIHQNEQLHSRSMEISRQKDEILFMSKQMDEINREKLSYFTNMAHEFKTPLTLIQGPAQQLEKQLAGKEQKESLRTIIRNAQYLLSLVNQLIDLRKIDTKNFTLNYADFDFRNFLDVVIADFSGLMKDRNITFECVTRLQSNFISSDKEQLHKVLFNLFSNAVKHTPDKGKITLYACQFGSGKGQTMQYISVANTGSSIPPEETERIFNRFYRIEAQNRFSVYGQSSTGIGLHIVKEIVNLLGGVIRVKSSEKSGVSFRLYFPVTLAAEGGKTEKEIHQTLVAVNENADAYVPIDAGKQVLLLVEDNPDMRRYIKTMLQEHYNVAEAGNGEQGYDVARRLMPDIIVSDLMMPVCDGMEFCRKIRQDRVLSHVPFVLLTANSDMEAQAESYESGADGYLTKPFDGSVLLAYLQSVVKNREIRRHKSEVEHGLSPEMKGIGQPDKQFMTGVLEALEKNYADPNFGVKELAGSLNISYAVVYKKMVALTGLSPVRFLQSYRLQMAKKLLESSSNVVVSEIAYRVGFNDPKYFTRVFVKQYGQTPSDFIKSS